MLKLVKRNSGLRCSSASWRKFNYGTREIITIYRRKDFYTSRARARLRTLPPSRKNQLQRNFPSNFAKFPIISFEPLRSPLLDRLAEFHRGAPWARYSARVCDKRTTKTAIHLDEFRDQRPKRKKKKKESNGTRGYECGNG